MSTYGEIAILESMTVNTVVMVVVKVSVGDMISKAHGKNERRYLLLWEKWVCQVEAVVESAGDLWGQEGDGAASPSIPLPSESHKQQAY